MNLRLFGPPERSSLRREGLICFLIFSLSLPLVFLLGRISFDPHHTGLMYKGALDVANGKILFAQTYTQYGALTTWIQALFLLLLGKKVTSVIFATSFFYALSYLLIYRLSRRFFAVWSSLAVTFITVFLAPFYSWDFHPWASVFANFFLLAALLFLMNTQGRSLKRALLYAGLSGCFVSLTFWCRQPVGLVSVLAGLLSLGLPTVLLRKQRDECRRYRQMLLSFIAGVVAGFLLLLLPILLTGAFRDFVTQSVCGMFSFAEERAGSGFFSRVGNLLFNLFLSPALKTDQWPVWNVLWCFLPLCAAAVAIFSAVQMVLCIRRKTPERASAFLPYLFYGIFATGAWHQYYPVACYRHWYWGAFLCVPAVFLVIRQTVFALFRLPKFTTRVRYRTAVLILVVLLAFAPNVVVRMVSGAEKLASTDGMILFENADYPDLNGLYLDGERTIYYQDYFAAMQRLKEDLPDVPVVNGTGDGEFALFGENFHPMFVNWGRFAYQDYPEELAAYIEEARPIYIGDEAPAEDYILWYAPEEGFSGDYWEESHHMPANVYIPAERLAQMQEKDGETPA